MAMLGWFSRHQDRPDVDPPVAQPPVLGDLRRDGPDEAGYRILDIYARKLPEYVVYRTVKRVSVQFADLRSDAAKQRRMMAALNPLRGEINGLIDGWRLRGERSSARRRAERFDRRVADALIAALEDDVADAQLLLMRIKQDILDERTAWARFQYLLVALGAGIVGTGIAYALSHLFDFPQVSDDLYQAAGAGLIGAFFSIALAIRGRTVLPDLQWIANAMDAALRMLVGLIGAGVLVAMVDAHMVNVTFGLPDTAPPAGTTPLQGSSGPAGGSISPTAAYNANFSVAETACSTARCSSQTWLRVLIFGFVAGFSERFVPDLLARASATAPVSEPLPKPPPASAPASDAPAARKSNDVADSAETDPKSDDPPHDYEAHDDNCTCDTPLDEAEATADEHLPAASGGVATFAAA